MPTIYSSADSGAPVLKNTAGALANVLDKCLVTGYGSKAAAGWTKPFTGTNKAVFRAGGSGVRHYLRIDDTSSGEARFRAFSDMTDVDTGNGTSGYPTPGQQVNGVVIYKNNPMMNWIVVAENNAFYLFAFYTTGLGNNSSPSSYSGYCFNLFFGRFKSYIASDSDNWAIFGDGSNPASSNYTFAALNSMLSGSQSNHYMSADYVGATKSVAFGKGGMTTSATEYWGRGGYTYPYSIGGTLTAQKDIPIIETISGGSLIRGVLPGIIMPTCNLTGANRTFDTFSGSGDDSGKTFIILPFNGSGQSVGPVSYMCYCIFQTNTTWDN